MFPLPVDIYRSLGKSKKTELSSPYWQIDRLLSVDTVCPSKWDPLDPSSLLNKKEISITYNCLIEIISRFMFYCYKTILYYYNVTNDTNLSDEVSLKEVFCCPLLVCLLEWRLRDLVGTISFSMSWSRSNVVENDVRSRIFNSEDVWIRNTMLATTGAMYLNVEHNGLTLWNKEWIKLLIEVFSSIDCFKLTQYRAK